MSERQCPSQPFHVQRLVGWPLDPQRPGLIFDGENGRPLVFEPIVAGVP